MTSNPREQVHAERHIHYGPILGKFFRLLLANKMSGDHLINGRTRRANIQEQIHAERRTFTYNNN